MGNIQRAVADIFKDEPHARLTVTEVAARVYPGRIVTRSDTNNIGRVLRQLAPTLDLCCSRVSAPGRFGWHHVWGRK
jgi:hypothetical protein